MNRRLFFQQLASGLIVSAAPTIFVPKPFKTVWKVSNPNWPRLVITNRYSSAVQKMAMEILVKQEQMAWAIVLKSLKNLPVKNR